MSSIVLGERCGANAGQTDFPFSGDGLVVSVTTSQFDTSINSVFPRNTVGRIAMAYTAGSIEMAGNGQVGPLDTINVMPAAINRFAFGQPQGQVASFGYIKHCAFSQTRMSAADIAALTSLQSF